MRKLLKVFPLNCQIDSSIYYLKRKVKNKKYNIYLSLSDDKPWAQATVIISYN